ncbi:MAG TPA: hypothetical protein VKU00_21300 [Chthonomonadaceae bacterium]|nr:hypothetical protein [Chthonomonadaceae bacterium]
MQRSALWIGLGLCGVTLGVFVWAQNKRPATTGKAGDHISLTPVNVTSAGGSAKASGGVAKPAHNTPGMRPLPFYDTNQISERMFARPLPPEPKPLPPPPPPKPVVLPPPPPPDPLAPYVYSGTVTLGDERMALLEDTRTRDGKYVKVGDMFMGGMVTQIEPGQVTIQMGEGMRTLAKSTTINLTPLNKSAAFLGGGQNGPGGPGGPGGMPAPGGPPPMVNTSFDMGAMQAQAQAEMMQAVQSKLQMVGGGDVVVEFGK